MQENLLVLDTTSSTSSSIANVKFFSAFNIDNMHPKLLCGEK